MKIQQITRSLCLLAFATLFSSAISTATPPVVMKVLVLTGGASETSYQSISTYLQQIGVPYQTVVLSGVTPDSSGNRLSKVTLSDSSTGRGLYQGIILSDSNFAACGVSCLSTTDWNTLNMYAVQFGVRIASYYTAPASQWGLIAADSGTSYTSASPLNATLTAAGAAVFPYLNAANAIPIAGQGTGSSIRAYRATPTAAANETTTPLLMAGSYTVGVIHTTADGREIIALTMDNTPTLLHSQAFGYGVINWVTKGVFLGSRKVYLNPESDDLLLGNWLYAPAQHPGCESRNTCPTYFATGPDLQALANWQTTLQSDPQFQGYRTTFAFNGVGTTWFASTDPVFAAIKSLNSQFWWLSHTWDHANLDCYTTNSKGSCVPASLTQSLAELNQNIAVVPKLGITFESTSMVTPYNSGLSNANFMQAAAQVGIKYIVFPGYPATPNTGIVNAFVPSILEVTRLNNDAFYDVSSPFTGVNGSWPDEYNDQYGPNGLTPIYSKNQTYSQILDNLSQEFLQTNMLTYAPYPIAFHIANMAAYDGSHSTFSDVMDATVTKYKNLFTLPVVSMSLDDIGGLLAARANYNGSGVVGVYTPGVSVVLTTANPATIPVTGICSQASCGTYGGQIQDNVVLAANGTVTIQLPALAGVSLASISINPSSVTGSTAGSGTVTLTGAAPAGGISISLTSNNTLASVPASVTVTTGSSTANFSISTNAVTAASPATITASYSGVSKTAAFTVTPAVLLSSLSISPSSVLGGSSAAGTITLSGPAPAGGVVVSLASNSASVSLPASVTVTAGSNSTSFAVSTSVVASSASATITANYGGVSKSATLALTPAASLLSVSLSPASVSGGAPASGTVTLSTAAPTGGVTISLSSNNPAATVPGSVTVSAGSNSANFVVSTAAVTVATSASLTASYGAVNRTAVLALNPSVTVSLSSLSVSPASVTGGSSTTGTVTLSSAAASGGATVSLSIDNAAATVPASVKVPAGSTTTTFTVSTTSVAFTTTANLSAVYGGVTKTAVLTVAPSSAVALSSVSVNPASVTSGNSSTGMVTLSTAAPAGGINVELWTSGTVAFVPANVTVAAGSTTATFAITTNYTATTLQDTVTAFYNGVSKTAIITVTP